MKNIKKFLSIIIVSAVITATLSTVSASGNGPVVNASNNDSSSLNVSDISLADTNVAEPAATGNTISGTISLPSGITAPSQGIEGQVYVESQNSDESYSIIFDIPSGASSTNYILTIPPEAISSIYRVSYWLDNNYNKYLNEGYYSSSGTTDYDSAMPVDVSVTSISGINLTLLAGNTISGTISMPSGTLAPAGGIDGEIYVESQDGSSSYFSNFTIGAASGSTSYNIAVPVGTPSSGYKVSYWLYENNIGYFSEGYYSTAGTTNSDSANIVNVSSGNITGINLSLLTGYTISGTVALPNGAVAPAGGIQGQVKANLQK